MSVIQSIIRKLGYRRCLFILCVSLLATMALQGTTYPNVRGMLDLEKCPACYGVSLCSDILEGPGKISISLDFWGRLGLLVNTIATKNVFSGKLDNREVIVKRLGQNFELEHLDRRICETLGYEEDCYLKMKEVVHKVPNLRDSVMKLLNQSTNTNDFRLRLCPSTEHVDSLFSSILPKINNTFPSRLSNDGFTANIWTLLLINPEPLLLQIMRAEDGWPVPYYLGTCGRIAVMLNAGEPLINYYIQSWPERAGLALQLLLAADRFTYSHPRFAFYLLDISSDNIAVNDAGKLAFVDLEHLIVVDRQPSNFPKTWNESHISELYDDCPGCSTFSSHDICNHHASDHNHLMICQNLLAPGVGSRNNFMPDGLLHSMPSQIRKQYPQIITYLQECSSGKNTNRIRSARRLRDILNIASKESPLFGDPTLVQTWKYF